MRQLALATMVCAVWGSSCWFTTLSSVQPSAAAAERPGDAAGLLFSEGFEDSRLLERGWYDGDKFTISDHQPFAGKGCLEYRWKAGTTTPASSSGIRHRFEPTEVVYLRCQIRLSQGWGWSGRPDHPHLMHFMTTENDKYRGPPL